MQFIVVKGLGRSSVERVSACHTGRRFPSLKLALCSVADGDAEVVFSYTLDDIILTSYILKAPGFSDRSKLTPDKQKPMEIIGISYSRVKYGRPDLRDTADD
jgi:hypothetical protein